MALDDCLWLENAGAVYNAIEYRHLLAALVQDKQGVLAPGDLKVTQRGAGANMSVDLAAGDAAIGGTESVPAQGFYFAHSEGVTNLTIGAANATNPRYDLVVARVRDSVYSGATNSIALEIVAGTPAGSPVEPSLGANSMVLARVLVPAASSTVVDANITERRVLTGPADLAQGRLQYKVLGSATGPGIVGSAVDVNGSSITQTVAAGRTVTYAAAIRLHSTIANDVFTLQVKRDGTSIGIQFDVPLPIATVGQTVLIEADDTPTAGSHVYKIVVARGGGTGSGTVDSSGWARLEDSGGSVA